MQNIICVCIWCHTEQHVQTESTVLRQVAQNMILMSHEVSWVCLSSELYGQSVAYAWHCSEHADCWSDDSISKHIEGLQIKTFQKKLHYQFKHWSMHTMTLHTWS